jgi:dienelactone hydrolase
MVFDPSSGSAPVDPLGGAKPPRRSDSHQPPPRLFRRNRFWLTLSILVCFFSAMGASFVQSSGGSVTVKNLTIETGTGRSLSALLLKPNGASSTNKRPAIVLAHGWWNTKEMQDANYVELARRGYVVLSIDMYGHGNSDAMPLGQEAVAATGMYDAVKSVAALPYVNTSKIGISGHSNGARACNWAVGLDNQATKPLVKAVYLVDNDPIYKQALAAGGSGSGYAAGKYINFYGNRDVGLQADQYDEFFFRSYNKAGEEVTPPRDYINTSNAQSFLHFGADPSGLGKRSPYTTYSKTIDGTKAIREINNPAQIHPWGPESKEEVTHLLAFFNQSFGTPNPIAATNQVWQWKAFFNAVGLIALGVFLVAFSKALLGTRAFAGLRMARPVEVISQNRKGLAWFWGGLAVSTVISAVSYWILQANPTIAGLSFVPNPPFNPQGAVFFIGLWAAINGVIGTIIMVLSWRLFGRAKGQSLKQVGALPGWKNFGLSILIGLITIAAAYGIVFLVGFLFDTDFRFWVVAVKPFTPDKLVDALIYLPLFAIYYLANAVAVNSFNRFHLREKEWLNTAVLSLFNALGPIILVLWQYIHFFVTGDLVPGFGGIDSIWLFPVILFLIVAPIISRKIYRVSNSPYIGGMIMAGMATLLSVTNTLTYTR